MEKKSCIVIGAGLSGLRAAYELTQRQWSVTVLEATTWTGGRVYSHHFDEAKHLVCEMGGEWIGRGHREMRYLCDKFKLDLPWHRFDFMFFERGKIRGEYKAGQRPFSEKANDEFDKLRREANAWSPRNQEVLDRKDWWTILRDRGFTRDELLRRDLMDSTDFGESIRHVGGFSAAAEYFGSNRYDDMDFRIEGGNRLLVDKLEAEIKRKRGTILCKRRVRKIRQDHARVHVTTTDGMSHKAAFCICTVPARALTKIDFEPQMPDDQWDAAKQLQYARIMKTALLFKDRFWMKGKRTKFSCFTDGASDFIFDATLGQEGPGGILCSYSIGDKADDLNAYPVQLLQKRIEDDLAAILGLPGSRAKASDLHKIPWQDNEFTQGAYALYRPGQWFAIHDFLSEPHKRVYFAGEHLAEQQGFMEGAVQTGRRAAELIAAR
jgi:monoamine oxidase